MASIHSASHGIFTIPALKSHFPEGIREWITRSASYMSSFQNFECLQFILPKKLKLINVRHFYVYYTLNITN